LAPTRPHTALVSRMAPTYILVLLFTVLDLSRAQEDGAASRAFGNDNFASTLTGMMGALQEMQEKGDKMIAEVQKQKGVLAVVNAEIEEAKSSLSNISNITADKEQYLGHIMEKVEKSETIIKSLEKDIREQLQLRKIETNKKLVAEQEAKAIRSIKVQIEKEFLKLKSEKKKVEESVSTLKEEKIREEKSLASLESERITTEKRLEFLRTEVKELKGVAAAKDQQKARIQSDLEPLLSEVQGKKSELESYMKEVTDLSGQLEEYTVKVDEKKGELDVITNQIDTSSKLLDDIKMNINNSRTDFDAADLPTTQVETSTLLPALLLSVLLNLVTGGHILMSNIKANKRGDTAMSAGMTDFLPTIKENLPKLTKSFFAKKDGLPSLPDQLLAPQDPLPMYADYGMPKEDSYYPEDDVVSSSEVDLNDLYSMLSDWSAGDNLGGMELPPTAMEALNYKETNRESVKIERRGGGKQKHPEYKDGSTEHRFTNPRIQDTYYNLPKSF